MKPLRLGIAGLGVAGGAIVPFAERHPEFVVVAGADPAAPSREAFGADGLAVYPTVEAMCADPNLDVVYVATPTPLHAEHARTALRLGKHVLVEKPMATSLQSAEAMMRAAEEAGRVLVVGHSQSFEAPIRTMRALVESGELGELRAVNAWYFTDWIYRPRETDELDPTKGGGVAMRQGAHHIDIIRYLGGGVLHSVRGTVGCWDPARQVDGAYTAFLEFDDGTPATAVYSGYGHFPSTELTFGIGETGQPMTGHGVARSRLMATLGDETPEHTRSSSNRRHELLRGGDKQPFFGLIVVSCEGGDMRVAPDGLWIYGDTTVREVTLSEEPVGRTAMLTELADAARGGTPPRHDGRWGLANLEACLALVESSATRSEILLTRQIPLSP